MEEHYWVANSGIYVGDLSPAGWNVLPRIGVMGRDRFLSQRFRAPLSCISQIQLRPLKVGPVRMARTIKRHPQIVNRYATRSIALLTWGNHLPGKRKTQNRLSWSKSLPWGCPLILSEPAIPSPIPTLPMQATLVLA